MSNILPKDTEDSKERKIMSKYPRMIKKEKEPTPVTIAPAKTSLKIINSKVRRKYRHWLRIRNMQKYCLKILEVIPEGEEKAYKFQEQQEAATTEAERWEKKKSEERQQKLPAKCQRLIHESKQQHKQKQRKKKQIQEDNDETVVTKTTQEPSLESEELECNLIVDEDDTYDNTIVIIPTQVIFRMKRNLKLRYKWKQKWQKEKYSRKVKLKIASMITNATKAYPTSEEDVSRDN